MFYGRRSAPTSTRKRPKKKKKNTACLVTYLIATGHHLCLRFPLLVFWAQTRLISRHPLIRGHISEHSGASYAACWEKWNAINQSGLLFNVNGQWKQTKCWLSRRCGNKVSSENKWESAKHCGCAFAPPPQETNKKKFCKVCWSPTYFLFCCINSNINRIFRRRSS